MGYLVINTLATILLKSELEIPDNELFKLKDDWDKLSEMDKIEIIKRYSNVNDDSMGYDVFQPMDDTVEIDYNNVSSDIVGFEYDSGK